MTGVAFDDRAVLTRVRDICMALPEAHEKLSHGSPTFFAGVKGKTFVMFANDHHGDGRLAIWVASPAGVQAEMVGESPERFFVPPYVGPSGWLGVRLTDEPDWVEVAAIIEEAYRKVALKRQLAALDGV